jgi:hypothetical protein
MIESEVLYMSNDLTSIAYQDKITWVEINNKFRTKFVYI